MPQGLVNDGRKTRLYIVVNGVLYYTMDAWVKLTALCSTKSYMPAAHKVEQHVGLQNIGEEGPSNCGVTKAPLAMRISVA
jgi:hypothetical protein